MELYEKTTPVTLKSPRKKMILKEEILTTYQLPFDTIHVR